MAQITILGDGFTSGTTHTAQTGTNRCLIIGFGWEITTSVPEIADVQYGNQAATFISFAYHGTATKNVVYMWRVMESGITAALNTTISYTLAPNSGTPNIFSGFLGDVHQTSPEVGANTGTASTGGTTIATGAMTTENNGLIVAVADHGSVTSWSPNNGFTERLDVAGANNTTCLITKVTTGASETPSATAGADNRRTIVAVALRTIAGISATIGQTTSTATAQAIAHAKSRTPAQCTETDTAQAITRKKTTLLGQCTETALAQNVMEPTAFLVTQCTETDLAQPITVNPYRRLINRSLETDLSQAISHFTLVQHFEPGAFVFTDFETSSVPQLVILGQASETDLAQTVTWRPQRRLAGQVTETDLAQAATSRKQKTLGFPTSIDTAQTILLHKRIIIGQATTQHTAQSVTVHRRRVVPIGQTTAQEIAQPITVDIDTAIVIPIGQTTEQDSAQTITAVLTPSIILTVGQAAEQAVAFGITVLHAGGGGFQGIRRRRSDPALLHRVIRVTTHK